MPPGRDIRLLRHRHHTLTISSFIFAAASSRLPAAKFSAAKFLIALLGKSCPTAPSLVGQDHRCVCFLSHGVYTIKACGVFVDTAHIANQTLLTRA